MDVLKSLQDVYGNEMFETAARGSLKQLSDDGHFGTATYLNPEKQISGYSLGDKFLLGIIFLIYTFILSKF